MNSENVHSRQTHVLSASANAVLLTTMYYDVFRHPLTLDELHKYCQWQSCTLSEVAVAVEELQALQVLDTTDGFYFIRGAENYINLRRERNQRALLYGHKAARWSRFISGFPFVRTVCISGSLSKGTMEKNGDIDYFIITEPGRLWITRTFLILFKKLFLLNSKKYFCVNYFIDTAHLSIPDRNLFTATEIVFVKPMRDAASFPSFVNENKWAKLFYPNATIEVPNIEPTRNGWAKRTVEKILIGSFGEWLDTRFFAMTLNRWKKKFPHLTESTFEIDFRSRKHVSKHHPQGFQGTVLRKIEEHRIALENRHNICIQSHTMEWTSVEE